MNYLNLFKEKEALHEGHFVLSSGLHSDRYFQSALLLQHPNIAELLGQKIAELFPDAVETVVSPALGGLIIGQEVARAKGTRAIFSEKNPEGKPVMRRGFTLREGEKVLLIEDVITTGLSTKEVAGLILGAKADLIGFGSIVNRSTEELKNLTAFKKPVKSLINLKVQTWKPSDCPLCEKGVPTVKPGSRKN